MTTVTEILRKGSMGSEVKVLQNLLNQKVPVVKLPRRRKLVEDGDFGSNTDAAVRTFQQLNRLTVDGVVGKSTWTALGVTYIDTSGSGGGAGGGNLVQLPQSGLGYYSYDEGKYQYGTEKTIQTINDVAQTFSQSHPNLQLGIGHISLALGGPFPPHSSHQNGTDIDIRPLRHDGSHSSVTISESEYSRQRTKWLVETLLAHSNVRKILFNDTQIAGVTSYPGHHNHLHVSTKA